MNTISIFKATLMKRVLIALALFACIGTSVMAQTYRPLTGTRLLLNSTYPSGGRLTLQANPSSDYTLTLPSASPSANAVLIGSTSGSFSWFTFSNGLQPSGSAIELGGSLTKNTTLDIGTRILAINSTSGGKLSVNSNMEVIATNGDVTLKSPAQSVSAEAATFVSLGNPSSLAQRSSFYLDKDKIELVLTDVTPKGFIGVSLSGTDAFISLEASQIDVTGNIIPSADDNYDLGSNANRFKDVYIGSSSLHIGTNSGTKELLVGYNNATQTAYFNIDAVSNVLTMNATNGLASSLAVAVGNGDATDLLTVNSGPGTNLQIAEDEIKRTDVLKIQGANGSGKSSQITLDRHADIATTDGNVKLKSGGGGTVSIESGTALDLLTSTAGQESKLSMSPTSTSEFRMVNPTVSWEGGVQVSLTGNFVETSSTLGAVTTSSLLDPTGKQASLKAIDGTDESSVIVTGGAAGNVAFTTATTERMRIASDGKVGIGVAAPAALLHVAAGTASMAAVKLENGTLRTPPEANAVEWDGTNLHVTDVAATRYVVAKGLTGNATLTFAMVNNTCDEKTVTVTGAADGDVVSIGIPNAAASAGVMFTGWVSAANTVTIRACEVLGTDQTPTGTFKVFVTKY